MAFREVTVIETKEVLRLWRSGVAKKRIAAQLGLDVKTVRGYLRVAEAVDPALDLDEATAAVVRVSGSDFGRCDPGSGTISSWWVCA